MNDEHKEKQYKNEQVAVDIEQHPGCLVKFLINVSPLACKAAYKKAIKSINKEVSLPGFRKGKAPEEMITKNYSSYIDQEWREVLIQTAFSEAVTLTRLYPLNEEVIKKPQLKQANKDEGAQIEIEFESTPQIPDINPKELKLKKKDKKEIEEKEIEEALENIRLHHAAWEDVEERGIETGDFIDVDIQDFENTERYLCKDTRFEVAEGKMGDWMIKLVLGKKVNDSVDGMSERSPGLDPEKEFKPTHCKITVKGIKKAQLPELDEELAKKVGVDSVEVLKERIKANLNSQAEEDVQENLREQLEKSLLDNFPFDVPQSLTQRELKNRLNSLQRELEKSGKSKEEIQKTIEDAHSSIEAEVKQSFQLFFLARHIANENKINITQNELVKELMLQMYSPGSTPIDTSLDPEEARSKVYINLLTRKVKDFLIEKSAIE